ncbi:hypothetical protein XELAEV_18000785mg [Xenopus laevis]|uniref:Type I interferon 11 n=1 Tax=Xenopus laevis TaxID=8355 RepID=A0A1B1FFT9_XENLA|nr:type I interferon 11 [Xenopus laevis]OCT59364.1 hypothetical protein XELAEV_18000785mg [Xenopus laevis]
MLSQESAVEQEHTATAAEVARLLNPVIEQAIDKSNDSQFSFTKSKGLEFEGNKILIFQDYSVKLSQKRKEFSNSCQQLVSLGINFALQYPAKLKMFLPFGPRIFGESSEAQHFVDHLGKHNNTNSLPQISTLNRITHLLSHKEII